MRSTRHYSTSSDTRVRPAGGTAERRTGSRARRRTGRPTDLPVYLRATPASQSPAWVSRTAVTAAGLPGDQVELVALDVGEGRPAGLVPLDVAEPLGAQAQQPLRLGVKGIADDVEVKAVLDGLRLRHLVEHDA